MESLKQRTDEGHHTRWFFLLIFAILTVGIISVGYLSYQRYERHYRNEVERQLATVADLKASELAQWRMERQGDGALFFKNPAFSSLVQCLLNNPLDAKAQRLLQDWMKIIQTYYRYDQVRLLDTQGVTRMSVPAEHRPLSAAVLRRIPEILQAKQVVFQDFYRDEHNQRIYLAVLVPILDVANNNRPLGILKLRINPEIYLYPFIRRWPTPSQTAETMLVRREGNEAVFLNALRFQTNAALNLRVSLEQTNRPAVQAAMGQENVMEGVDYQGVPVVAALRTLPDSPWHLVARMDTAEIYAPLRARLWQVIVSVAILICGAGAFVGLVWRQQRMRFYREKFKAGEALRQEQILMLTLMESLPDNVYFKDTASRFLRVNPAMARFFGLSDPAQLVGKSDADFFTAEHVQKALADEQAIMQTGQPLLDVEEQETWPDGHTSWVLTSKLPLRDPTGHIIGTCGISSDITARKQSEAALRGSEQHYRALFENMLNGFAYCQMIYDHQQHPVDFVYLAVNNAFEHLTGLKNVVGKPVSEVIPGIRELSPELFEAYGRVASTGKPESFEFDFKSLQQWLSIAVYCPAQGYFVAVFENITARKRAEAALRESETRLVRAQEVAHVGSWELTLASGACWASDEAFRIYGLEHTAAPLSLEAMQQMVIAEDRPRMDAAWRALLQAQGPYHEEFRIVRANDNAQRVVQTIATMESNAAGLPVKVVGTIQDITERKRTEEHLELLKHSIDIHFDGVYWMDTKNRFVYINHAGCKAVGYSREELIGQSVNMISPKASTDHMKYIWELLRKDGFYSGESVHRRKDGSEFPVEIMATYVRFGSSEYNCGFARNITERKRTETALRKAEEKYRSIFDHATDGIFQSTPNGTLLSVNPAFATIHGYASPEESMAAIHDIGRQLYKDPDRRKQMQRQLEEQGEVREFENQVYRKDGSVMWVSTNARVMRDPQGKVLFYEGFVRDITARKRAEETQHRLATAVEQAAETIVITDTSGVIVYANPAFEKITGYTLAEALGQNPRILQSGRHPAEFYQQMWAMLAAGRVWSGHIINKRKDGTLYEEDATISPVLDIAGKIVNYVAVKRDVTHEMALEAQTRQAAKMEAVGQLAGGVAHDFNNQLQVVLGCTEIILSTLPPDHPAQADLHEIQIAARRSADLTKQMLAFSRKQPIAPVVLDVNATIADNLKMLSRLIGENIQLHFVQQPALGRVFMDPSQLGQILANLAVNARDAITGTGTISIAATNRTLQETDCQDQDQAEFVPPGDYVALTFRDDGAGMTANVQAHIFEPFFTTKGPGKGTGLGLAMVYGIVKQNKGAITVESAPGQGTRFTIYLPRAADTAQAATEETEARKPTGTETVLLVEDEEAVLDLAQRILVQQGYKVLTAATPRSALRLCAQTLEPIHLLLTDVIMPEMSGKELAACIQSLRPDIHILYMSGYTADIMEQQGYLSAGVQVLQKPFTTATLAQHVRATLDAAPTPRPP